MGVFHVFKIVQMVPKRAEHLIYKSVKRLAMQINEKILHRSNICLKQIKIILRFSFPSPVLWKNIGPKKFYVILSGAMDVLFGVTLRKSLDLVCLPIEIFH